MSSLPQCPYTYCIYHARRSLHSHPGGHRVSAVARDGTVFMDTVQEVSSPGTTADKSSNNRKL
jgi:hypothetical protein